MASTQTKGETRRVGNLPTDAQLGTIATLADGLGVEAPSPETAREADEMIGKLKAAYEERSEEPPPVEAPDEGADDEPADPENEPADPPADPGLSPEAAKKMFDRALNAFGTALCTVFGVDELEPSQAPGVYGFLMPGFSEELPHPEFVRCTTCNGYGSVLTGSVKAGDERQPCPDRRCAGRGYWGPLSMQQTAPQLTAVPLPPSAPTNGEWPDAPAWLGNPNLSGGGA